jgi:hypothetical protein
MIAIPVGVDVVDVDVGKGDPDGEDVANVDVGRGDDEEKKVLVVVNEVDGIGAGAKVVDLRKVGLKTKDEFSLRGR